MIEDKEARMPAWHSYTLFIILMLSFSWNMANDI